MSLLTPKGAGLDDQGIVVPFPAASRTSYSRDMGGGGFHRGIAVGMWTWPGTCT